jgi:hypothetical protein
MGDDVDLAVETLASIASAHERVERRPQSTAFIDTVAADKLTLTLRH